MWKLAFVSEFAPAFDHIVRASFIAWRVFGTRLRWGFLLIYNLNNSLYIYLIWINSIMIQINLFELHLSRSIKIQIYSNPKLVLSAVQGLNFQKLTKWHVWMEKCPFWANKFAVIVSRLGIPLCLRGGVRDNFFRVSQNCRFELWKAYFRGEKITPQRHFRARIEKLTKWQGCYAK